MHGCPGKIVGVFGQIFFGFLKILLEQSDLTRPVARLMEGRLGEAPPPPQPEPAKSA